MTAKKKASTKGRTTPKKDVAEVEPPNALDRLNAMTRADLIMVEELIGLGVDQIESVLTGKGPKVKIASAVEYVSMLKDVKDGDEVGTFKDFLGLELEPIDPKD